MAIQYPPAEAGPSTAVAPGSGSITPPSSVGRVPKYRLAHSLGAHSRAVTALRFTNDGKTLISAGADGFLHFWDAYSGEHKRSLRCHRTGINDISLSPDDLYIATASDDQSSHIFPISDLSTKPPNTNNPSTQITGLATPLKTFTKPHTAPVLSVAFSPKSNLLVTGSFDESAIVWDVRRGTKLRVLPAHADAVWTVGWDSEGVMVLTGSADGLIRLWDVNTGQCLRTLDNDTNSPVSFATFTPSPYFLLSSTLSSTLRIHNIHTGKVLKTFKAPAYINEKFPCPALVFAAPAAPPISITATANATDPDTMDVDTPTPIQTEDQTKKTKAEAWVISGSENGKIIIWEVTSRRVIQVLEEGQGHRSPVVALAVHPNGRIIASGSLEPEKVIQLWREGGGDTGAAVEGEKSET